MWTREELVNYCNTIKENLNTYHSKWESLIAAKQAALDAQGISYQSYNEFIGGGDVTIRYYANANTSVTTEGGGDEISYVVYNLSYSVNGPSSYGYVDDHECTIEFGRHYEHIDDGMYIMTMKIASNDFNHLSSGDTIQFPEFTHYEYMLTEDDVRRGYIWVEYEQSVIYGDARHDDIAPEGSLYYTIANDLINYRGMSPTADSYSTVSSYSSLGATAYEVTTDMFWEESSGNGVTYITIDGVNYYIRYWPTGGSYTFNVPGRYYDDITDDAVANAWLQMFEDAGETGHDTYIVLKSIFSDGTEMGGRSCYGIEETEGYNIYYFTLSYPDEFFPGDTDEVYLVFTNPFNNEQRILDITSDCRERTYAEEERYDTDFSDYWLTFLYECVQTFDTDPNEIDWTNKIEIVTQSV